VKVMERLGDFKYGKQPDSGLYYNENKFRLELIGFKRVAAWVDVEMLFDLSEKDKKTLKTIILGSLEPMKTILADFFFPGWTINYYIKNGKQAERGF